ncbi:DMT family transporter [Rhizobacter sp. SG703]|uniref:DMT family transporter n=1 Tax=Rhizobacter sp. SG703 TaxID=2587140 RepID=UPI001444FBC7|nr:DMT family transporter [Rhizobacter sp. SG703]NKI96329.1 drug/metabolite transporter (DMT)-like permease [Rhizobacter sp. SG703]
MDIERKGLWLGFLGVAIFAMTTPMTRLAVGPAADPQLSPLFVVAGRAALAGVLSVFYLLLTGAPRPRGRQWTALAVSAAGTVVGFPLFLGLGLREVDAMHAAVITGVLPLGTAIAAALFFRQRPSVGFWACAAVGCALVLAFAAQSGSGLGRADGLLLLAVVSGSIGYVAGAHLSRQWHGEHVICWVLVISLPFTLPLMGWTWPAQPVRAGAWVGFGYVTLFSMWLGFFAWYRGLALGGTLRVSQVQLLQPFLSMLLAVPVLGERLSATTVFFSLAVIATVFVGRKMPTHAASSPPFSSDSSPVPSPVTPSRKSA